MLGLWRLLFDPSKLTPDTANHAPNPPDPASDPEYQRQMKDAIAARQRAERILASGGYESKSTRPA